MKAKPQKTLAEMASIAAGSGRLVCPKCACADFRTYKTQQGHVQVFRYKMCRHCGHKFITMQPPEKALRSVETFVEVEDEIEGDIV